ncbi:aminotransferase class V-fold PLP-dependent enzyme [Streptomyces reniochalinae]|uniref:Aminotransferase class V-fold PLP-dependent enzyme n=1 Tax=Streptomyces reniochalinae TaxID=2250578 RepID=A0A367EID4_9ACTN|nr:aminotransferase class V-fold PLP-dependent enzyme [Streptomyces reniochalinae]
MRNPHGNGRKDPVVSARAPTADPSLFLTWRKPVSDPVGSYGDWDPHDLEENGRALLARIRNHLENIRDIPVAPDIDARQLQDLIDEPLPDSPTGFDDILEDTWQRVVPYLTLWHHPSFHAYFSTSTSGPAILADALISTFNVNAHVWKSAPAAAAVERTVLCWMAQMVGYPQDADAVLVNGASLATLYALTAARDSSLGDLRIRERGLAGQDAPTLRIYASDQAHNSVDKAAIALGVGTDNVVRLPSDEHQRLQPSVLDAAIHDDLRHGRRPVAVVATVGTTSTGAVDPVEEIAEVCRGHGLWLHVDAAYGGFWRLVEDIRPHIASLESADSVVVNPHKVLFSSLEVTALYCKRKDALANTFRLVPEYLRTDPEESAVDYMNHSLQLGRQFRALKLWWIIRSFGRSGLAARLTRSVRMAETLRARAREHPDWTVAASSVLPLVCLRYEPASGFPQGEGTDSRRQFHDRLNASIRDAVSRSGETYLSHAVIPAGYVLRISIGNIQTRPEDVERLWELLKKTAEACHRNLLESERLLP